MVMSDVECLKDLKMTTVVMDGRLDKQQQGKVNSEGRKKKHATVLHLGNA